jgi:hypothetical protein
VEVHGGGPLPQARMASAHGGGPTAADLAARDRVGTDPMVAPRQRPDPMVARVWVLDPASGGAGRLVDLTSGITGGSDRWWRLDGLSGPHRWAQRTFGGHPK